MRTRKTYDEYQIHQFLYGTWEEVTGAETRKEGRELLKEYRANQPEIPAKMIKKRIKKEPA